MIGEEADRHKVQQLHRVPQVEVLWEPADEVSADEYVHDAKDEGHLFPCADDFGVVPTLP